MNTYYTLNLTQAQRNALLLAAEYTSEEIDVEPFNFSDEELKLLEPMKTAHELLKNAPQHPNVEDVYMHDAQHSGFTAGEKVLVEATVKVACMSMRLSSQHLPVLINDYSKGAITVTPHVNTVYHMEA